MKKTLRIAWLEVSTLFYSPIAWLLLIVFMIQCGLAYFPLLERWVTIRDMGGLSLAQIKNLTNNLFGPYVGLLYTIVSTLYLYIPLLTMGLMSRESSSGTIKLLYSSPVRIREIIFGKFLAMMAYNLMLIGVLFIFVLSGIMIIRSPDTGILFSALLGIYLLLCAYAAIGLFMSCLSSYQVVAALSTFVVFAFLAYVGGVWQGIDFVRDLTYFLSITGRVEKFELGLITTRDVLYFLVIIAMFLSFSILKLLDDRESRPWLTKAARYVVVVAAGLMIGYVSSRPGYIGYLDLTARKSNTLSLSSQKIIKGMDGLLEITTYVNLLDNTYYIGSPQMHNENLEHLENYLRFKPDIKLRYVYYYDSTRDASMYKSNPGKTLRQLAVKYARLNKVDLSKFKTPGEIRKIIDLRSESNRFVMQLSYKGHKTFLRAFIDAEPFPSEMEISAALKRLTVEVPKIGFLQGQLERSIDKRGDKDYFDLTSVKTFRYALVNQGFDVESVSLDSNREVPTDITTLVIADPRVAFSPAVLAKIKAYIAAGGNLLIAGEPGKQAILNPVLQPLGVQLLAGQIVQQSADYAPDLVLPYLTAAAGSFSRNMQRVFQDSGRVSMPGVAGLSYSNAGPFVVRPLLMTDGKLTWNKKDKLVLDSADVVYRPQDGDDKRSIPTALALTREVNGRQQRIAVTGDADFMSNKELTRNNVYTLNFAFDIGVFGWFSYNQFPVDIAFPKAKDDQINLTDTGLTTLQVLFQGILPGLLLIIGAVLLIRRKKQ
jgi:ABC-2 type transport system permease protein